MQCRLKPLETEYFIFGVHVPPDWFAQLVKNNNVMLYDDSLVSLTLDEEQEFINTGMIEGNEPFAVLSMPFDISNEICINKYDYVVYAPREIGDILVMDGEDFDENYETLKESD